MSISIKSNLDAVIKIADLRTRMALQEIGTVVLKSALQKSPVDTGRLRASITTIHEDGPRSLRLRIGSPVHYAGYVEGGTIKMMAQPYLRPALLVNQHIIKRIFKAIR